MSLPAFEDQVKYFNENSPPKEVLTLHSRKLAETDYSERDSSHEAARHVRKGRPSKSRNKKSHIWRTPAPLNARCPVCRQGIERIAKRSSRNLGRKGGGVKKGASVEIILRILEISGEWETRGNAMDFQRLRRRLRSNDLGSDKTDTPYSLLATYCAYSVYWLPPPNN